MLFEGSLLGVCSNCRHTHFCFLFFTPRKRLILRMVLEQTGLDIRSEPQPSLTEGACQSARRGELLLIPVEHIALRADRSVPGGELGGGGKTLFLGGLF